MLKIDQAGLPAGTPGVSRTDGLDTGAQVTLTNTGAGTTAFRLLWVPPGDTTAQSTLTVTGNPKVWTFTPTANVYGSYRIEMILNQGLGTETRERRVLVVRTPGRGLVIPAYGERGDSRANLTLADQEQIDAAENNADDFLSDPALNELRYAGWWRALHELVVSIDAGGDLPPGSFVGQTIAWDGSTYAPTDSLTVSALASNDGSGPVSNVQLGVEGVDPAIGFLGASPVGRQSIIGSNLGQQFNSLIEALVALGLVTDDRTSP